MVCNHIFIYVTTRVSCWTLLSSSLGVASAAGGPSLEAPRDLEWWPCELSVGFVEALNMKDMRLVFAGGLEVGWGVEHNPLEAPRFGLQDGPLAL